MTAAWQVMPGVPAAGHVTSGGYWHPGSPSGCSKCLQPSPTSERWGIPEVVDYTGLSEETIRSYRRDKLMPRQAGYQGQSPWWDPATIQRWREPGVRSAAGRPRKGEQA